MVGTGKIDADRARNVETACPTQALLDRRVLSERCISYLTIEHHGVIDRELANNFQGWWYGCDRCQDVCPWNRFAPAAADGRLTGSANSRSTLLELSSEKFDAYFAGSAVRRIGYERFRRNLLVALFSINEVDLARSILTDDAPAIVLQQAQELELL